MIAQSRRLVHSCGVAVLVRPSYLERVSLRLGGEPVERLLAVSLLGANLSALLPRSGIDADLLALGSRNCPWGFRFARSQKEQESRTVTHKEAC